MHKVLILTDKQDCHARAVSECLKRKGAQPIRWCPEEYLYSQKSTHSISPYYEHCQLVDEEKSINLIDVDVVWYRRAGLPKLSKALDPNDRPFANAENKRHMLSLWLTLGEFAFWVNPFTSFERSNSKPLQLREASRLGLLIPHTLISNDKKSIVQFIEQNEKTGAVYKTFSPAIWQEDGGQFNQYTTAILPDQLPDESIIALTPGIYQNRIKKEFEVRATFFGNECIAVKIHNAEAQDWRPLSSSLKISPLHFPIEIERKCQLLMHKLGIVFGCFDFIVTPSGDYVFLEVNEMGQFLWIEDALPELKLLDRFCEFLLSGSRRNNFNEPENRVSLSEIANSEFYRALTENDIHHHEAFEKQICH